VEHAGKSGIVQGGQRVLVALAIHDILLSNWSGLWERIRNFLDHFIGKIAAVFKSKRIPRRRSPGGGRKPPGRRVRELIAIIGRGGGKSRMAGAVASYVATCVDHSERLTGGTMDRREAQASLRMR
jgi:hypothetical protein